MSYTPHFCDAITALNFLYYALISSSVRLLFIVLIFYTNKTFSSVLRSIRLRRNNLIDIIYLCDAVDKMHKRDCGKNMIYTFRSFMLFFFSFFVSSGLVYLHCIRVYVFVCAQQISFSLCFTLVTITNC